MDEIKKLTCPKNYDKFDKKIIDKQFLLGKFYDATLSSLVSPACKDNHVNTKKFPKSKIRKLLQEQLKIHNKMIKENKDDGEVKQLIDQKENKEQMRRQLTNYHEYVFYQPLHNLWRQYILDLLSKQKNQQSRELRMLKSDFHGAFISVISSRNECLVGLEGIVIKQTLRTFQIVVKEHFSQTRSNKVVLKHICVFLIKVGKDLNFILNGNSLVYRPSDRIKHKFKFKKAQQVNHELLSAIGQLKSSSLDQKDAQIKAE